ncbi:MAG: nucleoside-diphosphate kinase [Candidatus Saganbacteria bacterium]|nr:nucleoside-diphosphate kinase [Candidatus Saganbacteria bacterium]
MKEQTFVMVKPDGVARGLTEDVFKRFQSAGLEVLLQQNLRMTIEQARELYLPHKGKPFYDGLVKFITSGTVVCSTIEGENAIAGVRDLMGATNPEEAAKGTIRGELKEANIRNEDGIIKNIVHGSDSAESAKREIAIFFND